MSTTGGMKPFERVIGIVGHPTTPEVSWSDSQIRALSEVGFETVQLSIAWASKPANEVLNLEDLDNADIAREWDRRLAQATAFGLRPLAHFGIPMGSQTDATTCILDPAVGDMYASRLQGLLHRFHALADVLIYTYDQRAWLCSEFGPCPRCHGVPLHERLPGFFDHLSAAVAEVRAGARLWWEPWELSAGQTLAVVEQVDPTHIGLILHNSIAEVQFVNTTDLWFRTLARLAHDRGIPVIGEGFFGGSGEDISPLTHLPCPRLVYQQLDALRHCEGVVGVKEYYGLVPADFSVNIALFAAYLRAPDAALDTLLKPLAVDYGEGVAAHLLEAWEQVARAMELFPWDASWGLRRVFERQPDELWLSVPLASWSTPSWQANRRGFYMVTDETMQHPWLREDVGLRARMAAAAFARAATLMHEAANGARSGQTDLQYQERDVRRASTIADALGRMLLDHRNDSL